MCRSSVIATPCNKFAFVLLVLLLLLQQAAGSLGYCLLSLLPLLSPVGIRSQSGGRLALAYCFNFFAFIVVVVVKFISRTFVVCVTSFGPYSCIIPMNPNLKCHPSFPLLPSAGPVVSSRVVPPVQRAGYSYFCCFDTVFHCFPVSVAFMKQR